MDVLKALEGYVSAVQAGSLLAAARQLGMTQPAIRQQISGLERKYNTKLLSRARNGVRMTRLGKLVYKYAIAILNEQSGLETALENLSGKIEGRLVVTTSLVFSQHILGEVIVQLTKQLPDLDIILKAEDGVKDLAAENIDLAFWSCQVGDRNGVVRKVGTMNLRHVATPKYLDSTARPQSPKDLINLDYIQYKSTDDSIATSLLNGMDTFQVPIKIGITAQFPDLVTQALFGNLGYAKIPEILVADAVKSGNLRSYYRSGKSLKKSFSLSFRQAKPIHRVLLHSFMHC